MMLMVVISGFGCQEDKKQQIFQTFVGLITYKNTSFNWHLVQKIATLSSSNVWSEIALLDIFSISIRLDQVNV